MNAGFLFWEAHNLFNVALLWMANTLIRPVKAARAKALLEDARSGRIRRVLVNNADGIGDAVVSLQFIKELSKKFKEVTVLSSANNDFVYREEGVRTRLAPADFFTNRETRTAMLFYNAAKSFFTRSKGSKKYNYDLIIDLGGNVRVKTYYSAKYIIGQNKGPLCIFYDNFIQQGFAMPDSPPIVESFCNLANECLGLSIRQKETLPLGFSRGKKKQVLILAGGKAPAKELTYEQWKRLATIVSKHANCIFADGPKQEIVSRMATDPEITDNRRIILVKGARTLSELAEIANQSALFIAVDGGGQHYLGRYTSLITIYTCTAPNPWLPFTEKPYRKTLLADKHVLESTTTSKGLFKAGFYRVERRLPYYGFFFNIAKEEMLSKLDISLLEDTIRRTLSFEKSRRR